MVLNLEKLDLTIQRHQYQHQHHPQIKSRMALKRTKQVKHSAESGPGSP